jgi:L,D-transpeptidase catalytic domain
VLATLAAVALLAPAPSAFALSRDYRGELQTRLGATAPAAPIAAPSRTGGAETALIAAPTAALSRPGGGRVVTHLRGETTWSHEAQVLLVLGSAEIAGREWLRVLLPVRPSGRAGWIPANRVSLRPDDVWLELDKGSRRLRAYRDGRLVHRYPVVIGRAATPTPSGLAAVYEINRQPDPTGFLGPWALPLTALSPTLRSFGGGPGRIAIHGRDGESLADPLGSAASHGCIRIPNGGIRWLAAQAAPGTPVRIVG